MFSEVRIVAIVIDTVNQGNWCLSIKLILECFPIVALCKQNAKALTYSKIDTKIQGFYHCL